MIFEFTDNALADLEYGKKHDSTKIVKIKALLENIMQTPYAGIGKPEPLRFDFVGYWSRRIDREHRLAYKVDDDTVTVFACRFHYES